MWKKILLGIVIFIVLVIGLVFFFTKSLTEVANKQLDALKRGDMTAAYSCTSKDFQATTSMADFTAFIDKYPSLKNNASASWLKREISNNIGTLSGSLKSVDGAVTPIEYRFVKENGEWKVLGILVNPTGAQIVNPSSSQSMSTSSATTPEAKAELAKGEIYQILVSDMVNNSKSVDQNKAVIPTNAPKIYASVYVLHAKKGLKVTAELVRLENGAKIGPSQAIISKDADVIRDFSFTNTGPSWPEGDYQINVTTSNNQSSTVQFSIK